MELVVINDGITNDKWSKHSQCVKLGNETIDQIIVRIWK